jgi:toxin CcdB
MRQFDVFENPVASQREGRPCRGAVVPPARRPAEVVVAPVSSTSGQAHVDFEVRFDGTRTLWSVLRAWSAIIEAADASSQDSSLAAYEDDIRRALDRLFTGF